MNVTDFIAKVRAVGQFPDNDEDITADFILSEGTQGLLERFTQPVIMLRNGSWLQKYTFSMVGGQSRYRIPQRSIAQGLEKFEIAMGISGTPQYRLLNVLTNIQSTDYEGLERGNYPSAFTYVGDTVVVYPTPSTSCSAHIWYYLRPSTLTSSAATSKTISAISGTNPYTLTITSHGFGSSGFIDLQQKTGNCEVVVPDLAFTSSNANTIVVSLDTDQAAQVSTSTTVANVVEQTQYIQLPQELCNGLVSYTAAVCLAEKGDSEKAQIFSQKCETAIKNIVDIAMPRSKGQPPVFKTRNTYLRRRIGRWGWGGWGGV